MTTNNGSHVVAVYAETKQLMAEIKEKTRLSYAVIVDEAIKAYATTLGGANGH